VVQFKIDLTFQPTNQKGMLSLGSLWLKTQSHFLTPAFPQTISGVSANYLQRFRKLSPAFPQTISSVSANYLRRFRKLSPAFPQTISSVSADGGLKEDARVV
jgi:hypothetical protein